MSCQLYKRRLLFCFAAAIFIFAGCAPEFQMPLEVCPGKGSVAEAVSALQSQSQNIVPLWAKGRCLLQYYADKRKHKEILSVKALVKPPVEMYLQGDATLVPKAIVLGSNQDEFWMLLRPAEISTYGWGKWSEQDSSETLIINPKTLLEALGIAEVDAEENWSLSNEGAFDILTKRDRGVAIKKIYVYSCDYLVRKIEYFDVYGQLAVVAELDRYKQVLEGFFVPARIKIIERSEDTREDSLSITLDLTSIKPASEKQQKFPFNRPPTRGFKHIIRKIGGRWIEQPQ